MSNKSSSHDQPDKADSTLTTEERRTIAPDLIMDSGMAWDKYKLPIVAGFALLVLALVGSEIYQSNLARSASDASALLNASKTDAEYQKVIDTYPGSQAAANAYLLLGRSKYDAKDFTGAAQAWQALADKFPKHSLVPSALTGVAGALEAQGKADEARAVYQQIATKYPDSFAAPLARLGEADVLLAQRKLEDARHVYEDLVASSKDGFAGRFAEQGLKTLNALPPIGATASPTPAASPVGTPAEPMAAPVAPVPAATAAPATPVPAASTVPVLEPKPSPLPTLEAAPSATPSASAPTPAAPEAAPAATP